jgi:hypothetical protein
MRSVSGVERVAALGAVIAAVALVAIVLFGRASDAYTVKATFANAGQLVKGNPVQTGGVPIGSVESISITDNGQAEIEMKIDDDHKPLRRGVHATIRQFSWGRSKASTASRPAARSASRSTPRALRRPRRTRRSGHPASWRPRRSTAASRSPSRSAG